MKRALITVIGPTGSGKSRLGLELAERLGGEIVCIDSTTVYRGLDVGTAKPTPEDQGRVPHHLLDRLELHESATSGWFKLRALEAVAAIESRGKLPILVGGSHLYLKALVEGYDIPEVEPDWTFREWAAGQPLEALWAELVQLDPGAEARVDRANPRRVVRALEVTRSGTSFSAGYRKQAPDFRVCALGLEAPTDWLKPRLEARFEEMIGRGWLEEVRELSKNGHRQDLERLRVIGYCEMLQMLDGSLDQSAVRERTLLATWRLVKKQRTWYRREPQTCWLDAGSSEPLETALAAWREFCAGE